MISHREVINGPRPVADFLQMANEAMANVGKLPPQLLAKMALNYVKFDLALASELDIKQFIVRQLASADDLSDLACQPEQPDADSVDDRLDDDELTVIRNHAELTGLSFKEARRSLIMPDSFGTDVRRIDSPPVGDTQTHFPELRVLPSDYCSDPADDFDLGPPPVSGH